MFEIEQYRENWMRFLEAAKYKARLVMTQSQLEESAVCGQPAFFNPKRTNCAGWEIDEGFVMQTLEDDYLTDAVIAESYILQIIAHGPICCHCLWNDSNNCVKGEHW